MISTADVKELREKTGISFAQCKKALEDAGGNPAKALESLKAQGEVIAAKKSKREVKVGVIHAYVHATGALGAMVELSCETDFVAKNPEFVALARDIAMHIVAMDPENVESLLAQSSIKNESTTIHHLLDEAIQKFGERVEISQFSRLSA